MTNTMSTTRAFLFTRARGFQPRPPDDLHPLASKHGLPGIIIPSYARHHATDCRAIEQSPLTVEHFPYPVYEAPMRYRRGRP